MIRRVLLTAAAASVLVCVVGLPSLAGATERLAQADEQAIIARLFDRGAGEEQVPVEGVRVIVRMDGDEIGESESDAEGVARIVVPGSGSYEVEVDTETIPDDLALRDEEKNILPNVLVFEGRDKSIVFPFGPGVGGAASRVDRLASLTFSGLRLGLVIAVSALGLSLIFGTTGLTNFAHGELLTFGALVAWFFNSPTTAGPTMTIALAAVLGVVAAGALGYSLERLMWSPLRRRGMNLISAMVVSIGLSLFLRHVYLVIFGGNPRPYRQYAAQAPVDVGPLSVPPKDFVIIAIATIVLLVVGIVMQRSRLGTAVRAVADSRDLAAASGIDVRRVIRVVWTGGAALAGLGGVLLALNEQVQWNMGFRFLLIMFAAVVLGGLGTPYGPVVGGVVIGLVSELSVYWFPTDFKIAFALGALILVLLVRPQGVLGIRERVG